MKRRRFSVEQIVAALSRPRWEFQSRSPGAAPFFSRVPFTPVVR